MFSRISHIAKFTGFIGMVALSLLSVSSCDNIYDDLSEIPSNNDKENCYTNVDATSYTTWVYLNFADGSQTSLPYDNTADIPADWTIALHRYDIKTNSGSAFRTGYTSLDEVKTAAKTGMFPMPDASEFTRDEPSKITIDMSHMMDGYIDYADANINNVIGKWLNIDTSSMPPDYTMDSNVYLVRTKSDNVYAIRFTGYSNPYQSNTKGYISFEYDRIK
ncbi:HmuY family protein [Xylanibacter rodentium]|uniref:HmuY family protein n=1 Tax=Xylanibacter rodentium TaxID=2736289 RepID=UPI002585EA66|nr:HmuY family protein [Xylanibacter rodentium]